MLELLIDGLRAHRSFAALAEAASRLDEAEFCEAFPAPCLVSPASLDDADGEDPFRTRGGERRFRPDSTLVLSRDEATDATRGQPNLGRLVRKGGLVVSFVEKSSRNPFLGMITIGRASNNDVVLNHPTISKMHAHLTGSGSHWEIDDDRSSNGTFVNRVPVTPGVHTPLAEGSLVRFGPSVNVQFHTPVGLYQALTAGR